MNKRRPFYHLLFWLAYYISFSLMESSYDYAFYKNYMLAGLIKLPLKMTCAYYLTYIIVPRFFYTKRYLALGASLAILIVLSGVLFRILHGYIILPMAYPRLEFTPWDIGRYFWALFEVLFPAAILVSLKLFGDRFENLRREQELKNEKMQMELSFLRSQLNPHFLFNTLNNIYGLSLVNAPETSESILKLSELLRFVLNQSALPRTTISEEIDIIEHYIALEKLRYEDRLHLDFEKNTDDPSQLIAPLLLLPLIENSFKHGASEAVADSYIQIKLLLRNGALRFEIRNNKDPEQVLNENGIGLKNIKRQLELIYPEHKLVINDTGTLFELILDIKLGENETS